MSRQPLTLRAGTGSFRDPLHECAAGCVQRLQVGASVPYDSGYFCIFHFVRSISSERPAMMLSTLSPKPSESSRNQPAAPALSLLCLTLLAGAAHAEGNPYYLGASLGVTSDSNVRQARDGAQTRDTIVSTGLRAGVDQSLGRSRLLVDLSADNKRYGEADEYNHTAYNLRGRLDWETIERLSGTALVNASQSLYRDTSRVEAARNLLRSEGASFQARLGVVTQWSFEAGLAANRNRFSAASYRSSNLDQFSYSGGVRFAPTPDVSTRLTLRRTDASYPQYTSAGANDVTRNDVELGASLRPSGASLLDAHVARTQESHSLALTRSKSHWTGGLGWTWQASGKSNVGLRISRDSTVGAYGQSGLDYSDASDATLRDVLSLSGRWQASSKIRLDAQLAYARRTLDTALKVPGSSATQTARDTTTTLSLGLTYELLRNVELGCGLGWENRSVSNELSTLTYPYSDTTFNCYTQVFLR